MAVPYPITHSEAEEAVGELVLHLQQNLYQTCEIRVTEIIKAGSLGHGTAVPGNFDVDLVLYSQDIDPHDVRDNGYTKWLDMLHSFLEETIAAKYTYKCTTRFAVKFLYNGNIDVDMLVSPYWGKVPQPLYQFLEKEVRPKERFRFTVNASKWQVDFFQKQPNEVKEYIKRAKAWRNKVWPKGGSGKPKSYFLSLLILRAYERSPKGKKKRAHLPMRITRELQKIVHSFKLNIHWEDGRAGKQYYYRRRDYSRLLPSRPRIIDPANPSNNLYITGIGNQPPNERASDYEPGDGNWAELKEHIHTLDLSKPVEYWL